MRGIRKKRREKGSEKKRQRREQLNPRDSGPDIGLYRRTALKFAVKSRLYIKATPDAYEDAHQRDDISRRDKMRRASRVFREISHYPQKLSELSSRARARARTYDTRRARDKSGGDDATR